MSTTPSPTCPDCGRPDLKPETGDRWQCSFCGSRAIVNEDGTIRRWLKLSMGGRKRRTHPCRRTANDLFREGR
jgi:DNA-directed RNA polymerase subunit RPC12/RpoP